MAYQSAFKERLADMETTRNHRLSLLQDEKDIQKSKSLLLSAKHSAIRLLEQRCLIMDHKLASNHFKISSLKSEIEFLDRKYHTCAQQLRDLKVEVEALEELEKEREEFYALKYSKMNEFKRECEESAEAICCRVKELRSIRDSKLNSHNLGLQKSNSEKRNSDIEAARMKNSELLALKQKVACSLESNKRMRATLQSLTA
ncbi:Synaptonemal complex protein 2-like [Bienertia sinuspersici]